MKAIIQAYNPGEVERIARGEQTIKICKTAPKDAPFKVYIYQSKKRWIYKILPWLKERQARVIGEFICDRVEEYEANYRGWYIYPQDEVCMWADEIACYGKGKPIYGLHISNLIIYDKPKELSEFKKVCPMKNSDCAKCEFYSHYSGSCTNWVTRAPQSWCYVEELEE